jgi:SAM-dependent methyltransferase
VSDAEIAKIRQFWDDQAAALGANPRATTPDHWLRELEIGSISTWLSSLEAGADILDIGCGNGYSTLRLAESFPGHRFVGGDFSAAMIASARAALAKRPALGDRVRFDVQDVLNLEAGAYDVVISDRCLINLPSFELQCDAVDQINAALRPGGLYLAIENFTGAQENLNRERASLGLEPITTRWHNLFLDQDAFLRYCGRTFEISKVEPISSTYYLVTRLVYAKLCQLQDIEPGYDDPIYEIATRLPAIGDLGPVKLVALRKRDQLETNASPRPER